MILKTIKLSVNLLCHWGKEGPSSSDTHRETHREEEATVNLLMASAGRDPRPKETAGSTGRSTTCQLDVPEHSFTPLGFHCLSGKAQVTSTSDSKLLSGWTESMQRSCFHAWPTPIWSKEGTLIRFLCQCGNTGVYRPMSEDLECWIKKASTFGLRINLGLDSPALI